MFLSICIAQIAFHCSYIKQKSKMLNYYSFKNKQLFDGLFLEHIYSEINTSSEYVTIRFSIIIKY